MPARGLRNEKTPPWRGSRSIAGAGYGHLSPTLAYRLAEIIQLW
jgi:hypothetical protein